ncbi:MAG: NAD(P)/FAD-dependent oxidoreductase [Scytolyngbya sp. HA4215-MV1]|jgi:pyruvate/2-oxoglutarate dehydrogenase complex dihydrolipoamide dehydrogenase (E3) component|nr:NAD(P)/FAD-dependent oxidoreductase [Scytolyngbya sp. HA4215-MV1]
MSVDYDLIIIGSTPAGIAAAIAAVSLKARVALVSDRWQIKETLDGAALNHFGRITQQAHPVLMSEERLGQSGDDRPWGSRYWLQLLAWVETISATLEEAHSPAVLSAMGIEVIEAVGTFCDRVPLTFRVNNRMLRSRAYLLAPSHAPIVPAIPGLAAIHYLTPTTLHKQPTLPQTLVVIGNEPSGIVLAQTLARFGSKVTIVTQQPRLIGWDDPQVARLLQAQLEAEGVRIFTQTSITQVRQIQAQKWVQAGDRAIETDEILLAAGQQPDVAALNLEVAGIRRLTRNQHMQTANSHIYLCGYSPMGNSAIHVAQAEARIAVKNALFFPRFTLDDHILPRTIFTDPEIASVGLTEPEALDRYRNRCLVLQVPLKSLVRAQMQDESTGFCKLIIHKNGKILGAHLVGNGASEAIGTIALALQQNLKIGQLAHLTFPSPTLTEILSQIVAEWQRYQHHQKRDWLETYFKLRRAWSH